MRIVICGAGSVGTHAARVLGEVHDVTVIDRHRPHGPAPVERFRRIAGDAADPAVLLQAGAPGADALVAVTGDDATNLLVSVLAKQRFGVGWTVARVNESAHRWLFTPAAGVDVVVSAAELVAQLVQEEVGAGDLVTLLRLRGGVAVTETTLPAGAAVAGIDASDVRMPEGIALTAVVRGDEVLIPARAGRLRAGDVVVALCEPGREHALHDVLTETASGVRHGTRRAPGSPTDSPGE
jgi:trk system potassium uptake protein TrkA